MTLVTEARPYRLVLVLSEDGFSAQTISKKIMAGALRRKTRNVVIHVVSRSPRPLYLEALRDVIQNNISLALTIRHEGSEPQDLERILRVHRDEEVDVVLDRSEERFVRVLEDFGVSYETVHMIRAGGEGA